ncbi:unnamed protein product [Soboliphyme baturini]|uniref:JmjC domain-containing protein n=1 Tax=Soboliphyme baturini TaxID=241478 RepID=A0A183IRS1_9BILA|nr:unnamed protein product [Soboliphyme baturini]
MTVPPLCQVSGGEFEHLITVDRHPNGGASVVIADFLKLSSVLDAEAMQRFAKTFFAVVMEEVEGRLIHVMGIIRGAASSMPDVLGHLETNYPTMNVACGNLTNPRAVSSMTMASYAQLVRRTFVGSTYRCGPMMSISLVGVRQEECGSYCNDLLDMLEANPLLKPLLPWGEFSSATMKSRQESDFGPILWIRPGEQTISTEQQPSAKQSKPADQDTTTLAYSTPLRLSSRREVLFEDRTRPHADFVGGGITRVPVAAVGVLKAVCNKNRNGRIVKEAVCFDSADFEKLVSLLQLDIYEPPISQCPKWVSLGKLNQLRREGIRYSCFQLLDNDVYVIPPKVIHQFRTLSACSTIAWHIPTARDLPSTNSPT